MTLGEAQREFTFHVQILIRHIYAVGYEATLGDAYRDPRSHGEMGVKGPYGRAQSAHKQRLAIDLNLFVDGQYLPHTWQHRRFGEYWKALHPDNRWGGDFEPKDGNHYSRKFNDIA